MKLMKRSGEYHASNVMFDPKNIIATSYRHWQFVKVISGKVVFNAYRYSNSTSKHQYKVRALMQELGVKIDVFANTRCSLSSLRTLKEVRETTKEQKIKEEKRLARKKLERSLKGKVERLNAKGLYSAEQRECMDRGWDYLSREVDSLIRSMEQK